MMADARQRAFDGDPQARAQWARLKATLGPGVTMLRNHDWAGVAKWCRTKPLTDLPFLWEVSERFPEIGERVYAEPTPRTEPPPPIEPPPSDPTPPPPPAPPTALDLRIAAPSPSDGAAGIPDIPPETLAHMSPDALDAVTTHSSRAAALAASPAPHPNGIWTPALARDVIINGSTIIASPDRNTALDATSTTAVWVTIDPSGRRLLRVDTTKPPNNDLTAQQLILLGHWEPNTQTLVLPPPHNGDGRRHAPVQIQSSTFVPPSGPSDVKKK